MKKTLLFLLLFLTAAAAAQQPPVVHPKPGETRLDAPSITVTFLTRKQNYPGGPAATQDVDVLSPKSVNIHPAGYKYYVNSLEGMRTVAFDFATGRKLKVIHHAFDSTHLALWAPSSGLFPFNYTYKDPWTFSGKPVESTFSHNGRYLWVPYYRRSYDINAQDPSAMAVIDTQRDTIVRIFETGPLPKMIATSPDGNRIAVTHWGDNTVGLLDISGNDPTRWHYVSCHIVDYKLKLNYSRTVSVNRDAGSGYCLRGTLFTPDGRYLLVGCMGAGGGIAVIDLQNDRYLGRILGMMSNLRHLILSGEYLYLSINNKGYVQRIPLSRILESIDGFDEKHTTVTLTDWESCKVPAGARTIVASPDGRFIFAACNFSSKIAVVDTRTMTLVGTLDADSYPVGLDLSQDGKYLLSTSQARPSGGGNAVDIFEIRYK
ncbi:MAG: beta-propeller fold lactonase family protein [Bacteroidales bacterium]|nr:beta-propeller fold lactonase family protein [Bacteroidales bacterium]MBQ2195167.1 beta-propeller fold lactonase family protein [Bacteroidales bacterium]MBQ5517846.1 beta-propeller fold lactonase family protein [Bacteroidales bacterium]